MQLSSEQPIGPGSDQLIPGSTTFDATPQMFGEWMSESIGLPVIVTLLLIYFGYTLLNHKVIIIVTSSTMFHILFDAGWRCADVNGKFSFQVLPLSQSRF